MAKPHQTPRWTRYLKTAARIAVSGGLLAAVLLSINLSKTATTLSHAAPLFIGLVAATLLIQVVTSAYKLMILVRCRVPSIRLTQMIRTVFISLFVGEFFPGTLGTEGARVYGVARDTSDPALSFSAVLMDRLMGLTGLLTVILLGLLIDDQGILHGIGYWAFAGLVLLVAGWLAVMTRRFRRLVDRLLQPRWLHLVHDKVQKVYACMDAFRKRPLLLAWSFTLAIFYNTIRAMAVFFAARAIGLNPPLAAFLVVVPLVILAVQIPITVGGFGVREMTYVSLLHAYYGIPKEAVLAMIFLIIVVGLCVEIIPGGILLMIAHSRRRKAAVSPPTPTDAPLSDPTISQS